jgi:hypothetical protein
LRRFGGERKLAAREIVCVGVCRVVDFEIDGVIELEWIMEWILLLILESIALLILESISGSGFFVKEGKE